MVGEQIDFAEAFDAIPRDLIKDKTGFDRHIVIWIRNF